jgi:hypothetical protein
MVSNAHIESLEKHRRARVCRDGETTGIDQFADYMIPIPLSTTNGRTARVPTAHQNRLKFLEQEPDLSKSLATKSVHSIESAGSNGKVRVKVRVGDVHRRDSNTTKVAVPSKHDAERIRELLSQALESSDAVPFSNSALRKGRVDDKRFGTIRSRSRGRTKGRRSVSRPRASGVDTTDQSVCSLSSARNSPRPRSHSGRRRRLVSSGEDETDLRPVSSRRESSFRADPTTPSRRTRSLGRGRSCPREYREQLYSTALERGVVRSRVPEEPERTPCLSTRERRNQEAREYKQDLALVEDSIKIDQFLSGLSRLFFVKLVFQSIS